MWPDLFCRTLLFVHSHLDRMVSKAHELDADCICLDLEDAVPENKKEEGIRIMETAFKTLVGIQGQVKEEI